MTEQAVRYESDGEIEAIVRGFESCSLPPSDFTHAAHLTVALWYVKRLTVEAAAGHMRAGLFRYLNHHGVEPGKYNETITLFWIKLIREFLDKAQRDRSMVETANEVIAWFADSKLIFEYYSREHLFSEEARGDWVEPDLKPLGF